MNPARPRHTAARLVGAMLTVSAAAALLLTGSPARSADAHDAPAAPAKAAARPLAKAVPAAPAAPGAQGADPMDTLREKLASKLGATKVPEAPTPYVVRVVAKSGGRRGDWRRGEAAVAREDR